MVHFFVWLLLSGGGGVILAVEASTLAWMTSLNGSSSGCFIEVTAVDWRAPFAGAIISWRGGVSSRLEVYLVIDGSLTRVCCAC